MAAPVTVRTQPVYGLPGPVNASPGGVFDLAVMRALPIHYWPLTDPVGTAAAKNLRVSAYPLDASGSGAFGAQRIVPNPGDLGTSWQSSGGFLETSAGTPPGLPTGSQPFTLMAATAMPSPPGGLEILAAWNGANNGVMLGFRSGDEIGFWTNEGDQELDFSYSAIADGNGHLLIGVYDGTNGYLYVDGTLRTSGAMSAPATTSAVYVGTDGRNGWGFTSGVIGRVGVWGAALTAGQVSGLWDVFDG